MSPENPYGNCYHSFNYMADFLYSKQVHIQNRYVYYENENFKVKLMISTEVARLLRWKRSKYHYGTVSEASPNYSWDLQEEVKMLKILYCLEVISMLDKRQRIKVGPINIARFIKPLVPYDEDILECGNQIFQKALNDLRWPKKYYEWIAWNWR